MGKILVKEGAQNVALGTVVALVVDDESELSQLDGYQVGGGGGDAAPKKEAKEESAPADAVTSHPAPTFPPHSVWNMPGLSPTMQTGSILQWGKQVKRRGWRVEG